MSAAKSLPTFTDKDTGRSIDGAPKPLPCPFCAVTDVSIAITDSRQSAFAECEHCGAQAAFAAGDEETPRTLVECALEAARLWNLRTGCVLSSVEAQRSRLINVLGVVQALKICARGESPIELEGALELVEENMQAILEGLEGPQLVKAIEARQLAEGERA